MARAASAASLGVPARRMPPALPRLPVGTCALTTHGPSAPAASPASSGVAHSLPRRIWIPAWATTGLAACSSKFMRHSFAVLGPERAEQLFLDRLVLGNHGGQMRDVDEVALVEVLAE